MGKATIVALVASAMFAACAAHAEDAVLQGKDAFGDYQRDEPGVWHRITAADMPAAFATEAARNFSKIAPRPAGAMPQVPTGFSVSLFASGLDTPRQMKMAPNGDIFLAESGTGRIHILRAPDGTGKAASDQVFAHVAPRPFGIAFYPPGPNPEWIYVASMNQMVRFAYHVGDAKARGAPQIIVPNLPGPVHWTRDVVATPDGKHLLLAVGSSTNIQENGPGPEHLRANILELDPDGKNEHVFASGLRNPVSLAFDPLDEALWSSVNERDLLGDNLPPDYVTHVEAGGFYGWPYFYIGNHRDPRVSGNPPVPGDEVVVPDVLVQPHSAPLGIAFYTGNQFPAEFRNQLFVALHGSWNRGQRTGYKLIRVEMNGAKATGRYEDFMTGFVTGDGQVWGRPVGVVMMKDGSLLMSDDGSNNVWRVAYQGGAAR